MFLNFKNIPLFNKSDKSDKKDITINSKYTIYDIENEINNILDKHDIKCKYYINITESYYCVSFNVGINQYETMVDTMFYLYLYKNNENTCIIKIVNEKEDHPEWTTIKNDLIKNLS